MSVVTNIILTFSSLNDTEEIIKKLKEFKTENEVPIYMVSIDDKKLPQHWYGGNKYFESEVLIGAFNHLNLESFLKFLKEKITWELPYSLCVMVKEQNDFAFRLIKLFEDDE